MRPDLVLEKLHVARQHLEQRRDLGLHERHQQQHEPADDDEREQEHDENGQRTRQPELLQAVGQRVADVGEQPRRDEWGEHGCEQVEQEARPAERSDRQQPLVVGHAPCSLARRLHSST